MTRRLCSLSRLIPLGLLLYWSLILVGTHLPGGAVRLPVVNDKLLHLGAFLGLGVLLAGAAALRSRPTWPLYGGLFLLALVYGALDEATQRLVPGRTAEVNDWLADAVGVALGLLLHRVGLALWQRRAGRCASVPRRAEVLTSGNDFRGHCGPPVLRRRTLPQDERDPAGARRVTLRRAKG
jgi:VanZ family protein